MLSALRRILVRLLPDSRVSSRRVSAGALAVSVWSVSATTATAAMQPVETLQHTDAWWQSSLTVAIAGVCTIAALALVVRRRNGILVSRARFAEEAASRVLASEERFRRIFDRGTDPQLLCDGERIVAANPAAIALLADGCGDLLLGVKTSLITDEADHPSSDDELTIETDVHSVRGHTLPVSLRRTRIPLGDGDITHYQLRDLREMRRLEAERRDLEVQLLASQRLEALGTLAGGVAHDFNNLLTVIRTNSEIAQLALDDQDREGVSESLVAMVQACDRARDIVKQILLFSRRSVPLHARINLAAMITDAQTLLRATIPSTVQLLVEVREAEAWINGDATQMQQLLLNLCSNAEHAMRDTNGGILRVSVDTLVVSASRQFARHPQLSAGRYIRLQVRDSGTGMSDDVRQRIFEPFFTTKPVGEGTGLGLAVLHGIVMAHHGSVFVDSEERAGTAFELLFAQVERPTEGASVLLNTPIYTTAITTPRDRVAVAADAPLVLLVDDEPGILRAAERGISSAGLRVITAGSGGAALDLLSAFEDVAVLITDQTMPEMTGLTLAEHARALRPSLPIILSTGFAGRVPSERLREAHIDTVLDKPYTLAQLTSAIDGALQGSRRRRMSRRA